MLESDNLMDIVKECSKIFDDSINLLSDIEFEIDSEKEDIIIPSMTKSDLVDMAHEVSNSARIKKAESLFIRRHLDNSGSQP